MRKLTIAFLAAGAVAIAATPAHANDSTAELATGGLIFVHNDNVEMVSEDLSISAKEVNEVVQEEPSAGMDPETLGLLASIGIEKGKRSAMDSAANS